MGLPRERQISPRDSACWWSFIFRSSVSPAEVGGNHAIDIDPITELQGNGHGEPASAQPRVGQSSAEGGGKEMEKRQQKKKVRVKDFMLGRPL